METPDLAEADPLNVGSGEIRRVVGCTPRATLVIHGDEGPTGFVWTDPATGEKAFRPGSGVVSGSGDPEDPYVIAGWCLPVPGIVLQDTDAHVVLRNNTITGPGPGDEAGVRMEDVTNATISGNRITAGTTGIGVWRARDVLVQGNEIHETHKHGIWIAQSQAVTIRENHLSQNDHAIGIGIVKDARVTMNRIHDNRVGILNAFSDSAWIDENLVTMNRDGIYVREADGVRVVDNTVDSHTSSGIAFDTSPRGLARDNRVTASGHEGVMFWYSGQGAAHNNTVTGNGFADDRSGIRFAGSGGSRASDNNVTGNANGMVFDDSPGPEVSHNRIQANENHGLRLWNAPGAQGQYNTIIGNRIGVVVEEDSEGTRLQENNIYNNHVGTGLDARAATGLDATHNWWGCPRGPDHPDCDAVTGDADTSGWLRTPAREAPGPEPGQGRGQSNRS